MRRWDFPVPRPRRKPSVRRSNPWPEAGPQKPQSRGRTDAKPLVPSAATKYESGRPPYSRFLPLFFGNEAFGSDSLAAPSSASFHPRVLVKQIKRGPKSCLSLISEPLFPLIEWADSFCVGPTPKPGHSGAIFHQVNLLSLSVPIFDCAQFLFALCL